MIIQGKKSRWIWTPYPSLYCVIVTHLQYELLFLGEDCVVPYPYELMDQPEMSQATLHPDQDILSLMMSQQQNLTA